VRPRHRRPGAGEPVQKRTALCGRGHRTRGGQHLYRSTRPRHAAQGFHVMRGSGRGGGKIGNVVRCNGTPQTGNPTHFSCASGHRWLPPWQQPRTKPTAMVPDSVARARAPPGDGVGRDGDIQTEAGVGVDKGLLARISFDAGYVPGPRPGAHRKLQARLSPSAYLSPVSISAFSCVFTSSRRFVSCSLRSPRGRTFVIPFSPSTTFCAKYGKSVLSDLQ